jgi:uncharacterized membrane protein
MNAADVVLVLAAVMVGITAGVMFCYQIAIMPGLHQLSDREFINAFRQLDRKIVNPLFVVSFLGGGALLVAGTVLEGPGSDRFGLLTAASVVYVVGVVIITMTWHVPRNNNLATFPVTIATAQDAAVARKSFEAPWNRLHAVRTLAAIAALAMLAASLTSSPA